MGLNLETLSVALKLDSAAFKQGIAEAESKFEGFKGKLESISAKATEIGKNLSAKVTAPLVAFGVAAVMAGSSLEQAIGKVDTVFGESAAGIREWSNTTADSLGISKTAALGFSGTFGMILQNMGFTEQASADVSMQLVETAADMSAMTDVPLDQSLNALRASLVGEMEPLKNLGFGFNQADIEARALALGLWDGTGAIDANAKAQATLALITDRTAIASGMFKAEADGASGSLMIMRAKLSDATAELGLKMLPIVTMAVHWFTMLIERFQGLDDRTQRIIIVVAGLAAALGPVLIVVGMMLPALGAMATAFALLLSPIGLLIAAIALLFVAYQTNFLGFADGVNRAVDTVVAKFNQFKPQILAVKDALVSAFNTAWPIVSEALSRIAETVRTTVAAITQVFQGWVSVITGIMQVIKGILTGDWEMIKTGVIGIVTGLKDVVLGTFNAWKAGVDLVIDAMKAAIPAAWQLIKDNVGRLAGEMKDNAVRLVTDMKNDAVARVNELKTDAVARATDMKNDIVSRVTDMKNDAIDRVTDMKNDAVARFSELKSDAVQRATDMKNDVTARITDLKTQAVQRFTELKDSAVAKIGEMKDSIITKGQELISGAGAQLDALKANVTAKFTEAKDSAVTTVSTLVSEVVAFFTGLPGDIVAAIGDLGSLLSDAGRELIGGFVDGITESLPSIDGVLSGITDRIPDINIPGRSPLWHAMQDIGSELGEFFTGGMADGMESGWSDVGRRIGGLTGDMGGTDFGGSGAFGGNSDRPIVIITPDPEKWIRYMKDAKEGGDFARNYGLEIALREGV